MIVVFLLKILGGKNFTWPLQSDISEYIVVESKRRTEKDKPKVKYLSIMIRIFKSGVMIPTVICIFAVDFHDFPRRLVKAHTFGLSLMDVGTGCLILISGI